jgi:hypothetical protein
MEIPMTKPPKPGQLRAGNLRVDIPRGVDPQVRVLRNRPVKGDDYNQRVAVFPWWHDPQHGQSLEEAKDAAELFANAPDLRDALNAILKEPYGCPFCDSGELRNPDKPHDADCGYAKAAKALSRLNSQQSGGE